LNLLKGKRYWPLLLEGKKVTGLDHYNEEEVVTCDFAEGGEKPTVFVSRKRKIREGRQVWGGDMAREKKNRKGRRRGQDGMVAQLGPYRG